MGGDGTNLIFQGRLNLRIFIFVIKIFNLAVQPVDRANNEALYRESDIDNVDKRKNGEKYQRA